MPSIYQPRRPRASPLWQIVHHAWGDFRAGYESAHRKTHGPLRHDAVAVVDQFYHRCGDLDAKLRKVSDTGNTFLSCPRRPLVLDAAEDCFSPQPLRSRCCAAPFWAELATRSAPIDLGNSPL